MIDRYNTPFRLKPGVWVFPSTEAGREQGNDILEIVQRKWTPPDYFYHFQDGGHVKALKDHLNSDYFAVADIKSFFQSTTRSMVIKALVKIGFKYVKALDIATNSTVKDPDLGGRRFVPHGFVQSALLATLCLDNSRLGSVIKAILDTGLVVTVYMDDIILSCKADEYSILEDAYEDIISVMGNDPYQSKTSKMQPPAASVEVFNVELSHQKIDVLDQRMEAFRNALDEYDSVHAVAAVIRYVNGLNHKQALELCEYVTR